MHELTATRHGPLSFTRLGETGPPLWLLPAAGRHAADFDAIRSELAGAFRTLAVDWPGCGATPALDDPRRTTPTLLADMVEDAVAALTPEPVVLLGHSVGGFCAARLAIRHPASVAGLVLVDSGGLAPLAAHERLLCRLKGMGLVTRILETAFARHHTRRHSRDTHAMLARVRQASGGRAYQESVAALWRHFPDVESQIGRAAAEIRSPTLLVWGARDPVLPVRTKGRWAERKIRGAQLHVLATGHTPFVEDPEGFLRVVWQFSSSPTPGPSAGHT